MLTLTKFILCASLPLCIMALCNEEDGRHFRVKLQNSADYCQREASLTIRFDKTGKVDKTDSLELFHKDCHWNWGYWEPPLDHSLGYDNCKRCDSEELTETIRGACREDCTEYITRKEFYPPGKGPSHVHRYY